jgi:hypothetical protein
VAARSLARRRGIIREFELLADDARAHGLADFDRSQSDPACSAEHKQVLARLQVPAMG